MAEFLTKEQIQSFLSRTAAKLRHAVALEDGDDEMDENDRVAEDEEAFSDARNITLMQQCAPLHPIVYGKWSLCSMSPRTRDWVPLQHGDELSEHRKKPYTDFISELVGACSCASSNLSQ